MSNPLDPNDDTKRSATPENNEGAKETDKTGFSIGDIMQAGKDSASGIFATHRNTQFEQRTIDFSTEDNSARNLGRYSNELKRELSRDFKSHFSNETDVKDVKEFRWTTGTFEPTGSILGLSGKPLFRPVKSEFKTPADDKQIDAFKHDLDKFLMETIEFASKQLTPAERQELINTRRNLAEATSKADVLSNVLHLARLYQHLRYIDEAKKAVQLSLGLDPDNMLGKQLFNELERMHPADISVATAAINAVSLSKSALRKRIFNLTGGKVIVLGDLLIDELLEGKPERISREAPVLILEHVDTVLIPGGAANTAHNIASLGGDCHTIGVCGNDEYALKLADILTRCRVSHSLVQDSTRPTTVKTRILSKSHSLMQQLLRLDRISHEPISKAIESSIINKLNQVAARYKAVVLSDYKAGVITHGVIDACRALSAHQELMVIVDAQQSFDRFKNVTLMTPNQPDMEKAVGYSLNTNDALQRAGDEIIARTGAKALLITRGAEGMVLFQPGVEMVKLPAFNRSDVFDVTGAGDTVVGTMALALVTGATFVEAMALGNLAAGIVVRKSGTAVTNQREMLDNLEMLRIAD